MKKLRFHKEQIFPLLLFVAVSVMFWIRSTSHIPVGDELRYYYTFEMKDGETNYFNFRKMHLIDDPAQVLPSMANHYLHVNGRVLVHTIEQCLSFGEWMEVFYVVNTGMFVFMLGLFIRLAVPVRLRSNPWVWLCTLFIFLYLFPMPGRLWVSVNLALNYLWPSVLTLCILLLWRRRPFKRRRWWYYTGVVIASLLCGATNEAFSMPLCGALWLCLFLRWRKTPKSKFFILIPLSIGCLFLLASPGNWNRVSASSGIFASYWEILSQLWVVWILLLILMLCGVFMQHELTKTIRRHLPSALALLIALLFGIVAHTASRAFTSIELFSAVLLMNLIVKFLPSPRRVAWFAVISVIIIAHQVGITVEHVKQYKSILAVEKRFRQNPNFAVAYDYEAPPGWLEPYIYYQVPTTQGAYYEWNILGHHLSGGKQMLNAVDASTLIAIEKMQMERDTTAALYPFRRIGNNAYIAPDSKNLPLYYDITDNRDRTSRASTRHMRILSSKGDTLRVAFLQPTFPSDSITSLRAVPRKKKKK